MKTKLLSIVIGLALSGAGLHAQTTNTFIVTPTTNVVLVPAAPAVTTSSPLTVRTVIIDAQRQKMTIYFVGQPAPIVISGAAFTSFQSQFQGQFAAAIAAYLQNQ